MMWLNFGLVVLLGWAIWQLRQQWQSAQAHQTQVLQKKVPTPAVPAPLAAVKPSPVTAAGYSEIAEKMLFSKDRNPTVILPPVEIKPPKPMPPLPILYGVMGLPSGPVALLSEAAGKGSKGYRKGENVGEFKITDLSTKQITLQWEDKTITKDINDMLDRSNGPAAASAASNAAPAPAAAGPASSSVTNIAPPSGKMGTPGVQMTADIRACQPGDTTPSGAVVDGMRKVSTATPFGTVCHWETIK
jgi:hypothetical protein